MNDNEILRRDNQRLGKKTDKDCQKDFQPTSHPQLSSYPKYMLRVRRLLCFVERVMEKRLTVTIATNSAVNTVNKMMNSNKEIIILS